MMTEHDSSRLERIEAMLLALQQNVTTDFHLIRSELQQLRADLAALESRRNADISDAKKKSPASPRLSNGSSPASPG